MNEIEYQIEKLSNHISIYDYDIKLLDNEIEELDNDIEDLENEYQNEIIFFQY